MQSHPRRRGSRPGAAARRARWCAATACSVVRDHVVDVARRRAAARTRTASSKSRIAMLSGNISESSRPPAWSTWYRPSLRVARAAQHAVRRAGNERGRARGTCRASRCSRHARERLATGTSTFSGCLERDVDAPARRPRPSGANARMPVRRSQHEDDRERDDEHARPERADEVHEPVARGRVGVAGRSEHEHDRGERDHAATARTNAGARARSGTNGQARERRAARRSGSTIAAWVACPRPTSTAAASGRARGATPRRRTAAAPRPRRTTCWPNSSASMIAGFASTAAAHQPRRSSGKRDERRRRCTRPRRARSTA